MSFCCGKKTRNKQGSRLKRMIHQKAELCCIRYMVVLSAGCHAIKDRYIFKWTNTSSRVEKLYSNAVAHALSGFLQNRLKQIYVYIQITILSDFPRHFRIFYLNTRHTANTLESTIKTIETYHGEIMAIDRKIAMMLPNTQLRFC